MTRAEIAKVCHEANRAYCETLGDQSQPRWEEAPEWQRNSAMLGVELHLNNPHAGPETSHESWMSQKVAEGWVYGEKKDPELKTHPCLLPFNQLPKEQQVKDYLFRAVVHACKAVCITGVLFLSGCITPYQEPSGRYIKTSQTEIRSAFGTNQSFARLERCDGPEKKPWYFVDKDFRNCVLLTAQEQNEWQHGFSRGAGPEIVGAAIVGGSVGAGAALSGGANASAGAAASATNIAVQTVNPHKKH